MSLQDISNHSTSDVIYFICQLQKLLSKVSGFLLPLLWFCIQSSFYDPSLLYQLNGRDGWFFSPRVKMNTRLEIELSSQTELSTWISHITHTSYQHHTHHGLLLWINIFSWQVQHGSSTYLCVETFSKLKYAKPACRPVLIHQHFQSSKTLHRTIKDRKLWWAIITFVLKIDWKWWSINHRFWATIWFSYVS